MSNPWNGADALAVVVEGGPTDTGGCLVDDATVGAGPRAAADLDRGIALLREVASGTRPPTLRLYRPSPTVAFGQRDARLDEHLRAEVGEPAGDRRRGVDDRGDPGGHQRVGGGAVEIDLVEDGDVAGF